MKQIFAGDRNAKPHLLRRPLHIRIGDLANSPDYRRMRCEESFRETSRLDYSHAGKQPDRDSALEKADEGADNRVHRLRYKKGDEPRDNAAQQAKHDERDNEIRDRGKAFLRRIATDPVSGLHKPMQGRKGEISHGKGGDKADKRPQLARKAAEQPHDGKERRNGQ